ncbi:MAG: hypothetical protein IJX62_03220 [Clostridia bacterium]|nr:hypothetical protein [Clostridia bacterium]
MIGKIRRIGAALVCVCVIMMTASSCGVLRLMDAILPWDPLPVEERYEYTLTQAEVDEFHSLLARCEELLVPEGKETRKIEKALGEMTEAFYHISTQASLAYLQFCMNNTDKACSDRYLFASAASSESYAAYMKLCQRVDSSKSAYRDTFFDGWSEAEMAKMRSYTDEMAALQKTNDAILVELRELKQEDFDKSVPALFKRTVETNTAMARLMGYEGYMEYAYACVYGREYTPEQVKAVWRYVQTYLVPLCRQLGEDFYAAYEALPKGRADDLYELLYGDYTDGGNDLLEGYFSTLPATLRQGMEGMLKNQNDIFCHQDNALEGEFTGYLYDDGHPVDYFGPGYQSLLTVVHEAGHYCAFVQTRGLEPSLDLAEVHSQGNELLWMAYAADHVNAYVYRVMELYQFYQTVDSVIACLMVDEFEQTVYAGGGTVTDYDGVMTQICARYGGVDFVEKWITDMKSYWRNVVIESPGYYISYATSGLAALGLYATADADYARGVGAYGILMEQAARDASLTDSLKAAGLSTPFEEALYKKIINLYDTEEQAA